MAKNAGTLLVEEVFKEPAKLKEATKEELKSDDFSLILTQWKASTSRKTATTGFSSSRIPPMAKDPPSGKVSIVPAATADTNPTNPSAASQVVSNNGTESAPAVGASVVVDEKGKKATLFWSAMKNKANPAAALVLVYYYYYI